ncbi:hypothetical protein [Novosphingobium sp.]|uniref:hypothetical protein n=1 Tax=Novosphingobium sp. TaxID=1874826 RepID=UPI00286A29D1|nr:hypothetical protein [Novosphingobium sp.]
MPTPIQNPVGYAVTRAVAYADVDGSMIQVAAAAPLPVSIGASAATTPLAATAAASTVAGPYQPALGRAVMLVLTGTWSGTVSVTRSVDGGTTRQPLTVNGNVWGQYFGNVCEAVWEESESAARLYLEITLASGSVSYRLAQ